MQLSLQAMRSCADTCIWQAFAGWACLGCAGVGSFVIGHPCFLKIQETAVVTVLLSSTSSQPLTATCCCVGGW
jgi:hypothetical protein